MEQIPSFFNISGIKCDNCDFKDPSVKAEEYNIWLNKPCPKCGCNLLTEKDYKLFQTMIELNNQSKDISSILSPTKLRQSLKSIPLSLDPTGSIKIKEDDYKVEDDSSNNNQANVPIEDIPVFSDKFFDDLNTNQNENISQELKEYNKPVKSSPVVTIDDLIDICIKTIKTVENVEETNKSVFILSWLKSIKEDMSITENEKIKDYTIVDLPNIINFKEKREQGLIELYKLLGFDDTKHSTCHTSGVIINPEDAEVMVENIDTAIWLNLGPSQNKSIPKGKVKLMDNWCE